MTERAAVGEALEVALVPGGTMARVLALPDYWVLFWVPALGPDATVLYQFMALLLLRGERVPDVERIALRTGLGTAERVREAVAKLGRLRLLTSAGAGRGLTLVHPAPFMSGAFAEEHLGSDLAAEHQRYLDAAGVAVPTAPTSPRQESLLGDTAPAAPPLAAPAVVRRGRKTHPQAQQIVEHFRQRAAEGLGAPEFVVSDYGKEMRIASALITDLGIERTLAVVDAFFRTERQRAARVSSLSEIRGMANQLATRAVHNVSPPDPRRDDRVARPSLPGYGQERPGVRDERSTQRW